MKQRFNIVVCLLLTMLLQACAGSGVAPVANRNEVRTPSVTVQSSVSQAARKTVVKKDKAAHHIVRQGDTLYSIAWRYNHDYRDIATWNQIARPYTIYPNQQIRLKPVLRKIKTNNRSYVENKIKQAKRAAKKSIQPKKLVKRPKPLKAEKSTKVVKQKKPEKVVESTKPQRASSASAVNKGKIRWSWPSLGKIAKENSPTTKKGLNILGKNGQSIKAAAKGEVVYSGSGLVGYGQLIIIKHNDVYLSAYAYNSRLLVKEGDVVKVGQRISEMGTDHTGRAVLHFEIRKNGKTVNPIFLLPKKKA